MSAIVYRGRPTSYDLAVSRGLVPGVAAFRKFGANGAIAANATYIGSVSTVTSVPHMLSAPSTMEAIGVNATDTVSTAGARTVTIFGLNSNWDATSEIVDLAGVSSSPLTSTEFYRVYRTFVNGTGTYRGTNVSALTVRTSTGQACVGIKAGYGQTEGSHYTVPAGYSLYIKDVHLQVSATKKVDINFWQAPNANDLTVVYSGAKRIVEDYVGVTGQVDFEYTPYLKFPAYTDMWLTGAAAAGGGEASVEYNGYLVQE